MAGEKIALESLALAHFEQHLPDSEEARRLFQRFQSVLRRCESRLGQAQEPPQFPAAVWSLLCCEVLSPSVPWPLHELLYSAAFCHWDADTRGPPPVWTPARSLLRGQASETNIGLLLRNHGSTLLKEKWTPGTDPATVFPLLQRLSYDEPQVYWPAILAELQIVFHRPPTRIAEFEPECSTSGRGEGDGSHLSGESRLPGGRWLPGASFNIAESCLLPTDDGKRRDDRLAIVWREEGSDGVPRPGLQSRTLAQVRLLARQVAAGLVSLGLGHGPAVAVYLPMTPDSVCAYLGLLLAGATVVSIAESFSPSELASRLKISGARAVITQDVAVRGGKAIPLYSRVVEAGAPQAIVLQATPSPGDPQGSSPLRPGDLLFSEVARRGEEREPLFTPPAMATDFPCNILFSSGTTGVPKAIPWSQATPIKAAADAFVHQDVKPGDVVAWPTSLGWMMGPWLVFAALVNGATIGLYCGNPATQGFLNFVQDAGVTMLGVIPSLVRSWRALGSTARQPLNWSAVRAFSSTGEASTPSDVLWLMSRAAYRAPVLEYCGGTEIGGAFATGALVQPQGLSCFSTPAMGCRILLLDQATGEPMDEGAACMGECALMPRMLGASWKLLNGDNFAVYFKGMPTYRGQILRRHGDAFERLGKGYLRAQGRIDDTMNLGGIKVSSVEIERACNRAHPAVVETAAVGVPPPQGGPEELVLFAVLKEGSASNGVSESALLRAFTEELRQKLNPLFKVGRVEVVRELPRTATNKVMRRKLRDDLLKLQRDKAHKARL